LANASTNANPLAPQRIAWTVLRLDDQDQLHTDGQWTDMNLAAFHPMLQYAVQHHLSPQWVLPPAAVLKNWRLKSQWRIRWPLVHDDRNKAALPPQVNLSISHQQGDIEARNPDPIGARTHATLPLGIERMQWQLQSAGNQWRSQLQWQTTRAGQIDAQVNVPMGPASTGWAPTPDTALAGRVQAQLPDLSVWSLLTPPGWRSQGALELDAMVSGTWAAPAWTGQLQATQLAVQSNLDGLSFGNGYLKAQLNGHDMRIETLHLEGSGGAASGGTLDMSGMAHWPNGQPQLQIKAIAKQLKVSNRADRRLVLSGQVEASINANQLQLMGKLQADQASFILPDESTPQLGDDVIVTTKQAKSTPSTESHVQTARTPTGQPLETLVQLELDLGKHFEVKGQGLQTHLTGTVKLISTPTQALQVQGNVQTQNGVYRAYGQLLNIQEGTLRFTGAYDDPSLNVLALRTTTTPHWQGQGADNQQVGVRVLGTAKNPVIQLYADPEMPDNDKLAWLLLGRPAYGVGGEAALLQQAAVALFSRNGDANAPSFANRIGLDEVSIKGSTANSSTAASASAVMLGKRLSNKVYIAYEQSLGGAAGVMSLFYNVSRRLTLRAQTGQYQALDLILTLTHD
jgi:translocation and assembly module TamB